MPLGETRGLPLPPGSRCPDPSIMGRTVRPVGKLAGDGLAGDGQGVEVDRGACVQAQEVLPVWVVPVPAGKLPELQADLARRAAVPGLFRHAVHDDAGHVLHAGLALAPGLADEGAGEDVSVV